MLSESSQNAFILSNKSAKFVLASLLKDDLSGIEISLQSLTKKYLHVFWVYEEIYHLQLAAKDFFVNLMKKLLLSFPSRLYEFLVKMKAQKVTHALACWKNSRSPFAYWANLAFKSNFFEEDWRDLGSAFASSPRSKFSKVLSKRVILFFSSSSRELFYLFF